MENMGRRYGTTQATAAYSFSANATEVPDTTPQWWYGLLQLDWT
jgi:hypothetical protein